MRFAASLVLLVTLLGGCSPTLRLRRVVLYQNGIGYFEHTGVPNAERLSLELEAHEVDDAMKTLTVLGADGTAVVSAVVPALRPRADGEDASTLDVVLGRTREALTVTYAVPTPQWRTMYRVVLSEREDTALLQAWAIVHNASNEDWEDVQLTLATGAPFTYDLDLRAPQFVSRPDLSGTLVPPIAPAPVLATRARDDGDRAGPEDLCPLGAEDYDGFEDDDGCADPDNDQDRIPDAQDSCPNDPETYNGQDDADGCPDTGLVVVESDAIVVLEKIYFLNRSATIQSRSYPLLDAIAQTLAANPHIARILVIGHAAANERGAERLSRDRATAVQRALIARGIDPGRLRIEGRAARQPVNPRRHPRAYDQNRRVEFYIDEFSEPSEERRPARRPAPGALPPSAPRPVTPATAGGAARALALSETASGETRFALTLPVSIPRQSATMVAVLDETLEGGEVLLYRPESRVPLSTSRPFRAARLVNGPGYRLLRGPVAIYARGTYVGEGVLDGLAPRESTFLPYALDAGTVVTRSVETTRRPLRIKRIERGRLQVEDRLERRSRYEVKAGARVPLRLWIQHQTAGGYTPVDPPGETEMARGNTLLVPLDIEPASERSLELREERVSSNSYPLGSWQESLDRYLETDDALPDDVRRALEGILRLRTELRAREERRLLVAEQAMLQSRRLGELQSNLQAIERSTTARELRSELQESLAAAEAESERLSEELVALAAEIAETRIRLQEDLRELRYEADANDSATGQ